MALIDAEEISILESANGKTRDPPAKLSPTIDFTAGTIAGLTSLVVGFPFDTVKVRFQDPNTASRYSGTINAFTTIIKEERISGLYKGVTAPMLGCGFLNGLVFGSYGLLMRVQLDKDQVEPTLRQIFLAGAGTGIISTFITCPTELVKIRQQSTLDNAKLPSVWQITSDIYKQKGIAGLYRGFVPTALRELGFGVYFLTYEAVCRGLKGGKNDAPVPWYGLLLAGGLAGPASWITTFPADVIKTRMQTAPSAPALPSTFASMSTSTAASTSFSRSSSHSHVHSHVHAHAPSPAAFHSSSLSIANSSAIVNTIERSMLATIVHCYRKEGLKSFFAGLSPTLIRAVPVNMVTFGTFELAVSLLTR